MTVIIRLQYLPWAANASDIREFFRGLTIPEGNVHIVGGRDGDAFIGFASDEDARLAMQTDGKKIKDSRIRLLLSSRVEMEKVIAKARGESERSPSPPTRQRRSRSPEPRHNKSRDSPTRSRSPLNLNDRSNSRRSPAPAPAPVTGYSSFQPPKLGYYTPHGQQQRDNRFQMSPPTRNENRPMPDVRQPPPQIPPMNAPPPPFAIPPPQQNIRNNSRAFNADSQQRNERTTGNWDNKGNSSQSNPWLEHSNTQRYDEPRRNDRDRPFVPQNQNQTFVTPWESGVPPGHIPPPSLVQQPPAVDHQQRQDNTHRNGGNNSGGGIFSEQRGNQYQYGDRERDVPAHFDDPRRDRNRPYQDFDSRSRPPQNQPSNEAFRPEAFQMPPMQQHSSQYPPSLMVGQMKPPQIMPDTQPKAPEPNRAARPGLLPMPPPDMERSEEGIQGSDRPMDTTGPNVRSWSGSDRSHNPAFLQRPPPPMQMQMQRDAQMQIRPPLMGGGQRDLPPMETTIVELSNVAYRSEERDISVFLNGLVPEKMDRICRDDGWASGFWVVRFDSPLDARRACELSGRELLGRTVGVRPLPPDHDPNAGRQPPLKQRRPPPPNSQYERDDRRRNQRYESHGERHDERSYNRGGERVRDREREKMPDRDRERERERGSDRDNDRRSHSSHQHSDEPKREDGSRKDDRRRHDRTDRRDEDHSHRRSPPKVARLSEVCVYLSGLPSTIAERDVAAFFDGLRLAPNGIRLMKEPKGTAYAEFVSSGDCEKAVSKDRAYMGSQKISVVPVSQSAMIEAVEKQFAVSFNSNNGQLTQTTLAPSLSPQEPERVCLTPGPPPGTQAIDPDVVTSIGNPGCVLAIHHLPPSITLEEMCQVFAPFNVLEDSVRMHYNDLGEPTGDCLLATKTPSDASNAVAQLHGRVMDGRPVRIYVVSASPVKLLP